MANEETLEIFEFMDAVRRSMQHGRPAMKLRAPNRNGVLAPVLRAVVDTQDLNRSQFVINTVNGDIGQRREQNFSGTFLVPGSASVRRLPQ
jgi:hypothetical protein